LNMLRLNLAQCHDLKVDKVVNMEREIKNKAASVRAKLMNIARAEKVDFDFLLLRYFQERFLYRRDKTRGRFVCHIYLSGGRRLCQVNNSVIFRVKPIGSEEFLNRMD